MSEGVWVPVPDHRPACHDWDAAPLRCDFCGGAVRTAGPDGFGAVHAWPQPTKVQVPGPDPGLLDAQNAAARHAADHYRAQVGQPPLTDEEWEALNDPEFEEHEWVVDPVRVHNHVGHEIEIGTYADRNLAIECITCGEVIADIDYEAIP